MRLRRKRVIPERHTEFSSVLFDVLFGLLLFMGIEALFGLRGAGPILLVVAALAIVAYWWLKYKAAGETYGTESGSSAVGLVFGLLEIVLLQNAVAAATRGEAVIAAFYFSLPLLTEAVRALLWRFFGNWRRASRERIGYMEQQLETTIFLNFGTAAALGALIVNAGLLSLAGFLGFFAGIYALYAILAACWELVDLRPF